MSLELIEVRAYLDLVLCTAVQIFKDGTMVRRGLHILDQPGVADSPVKNPVTLNIPRLTGDLIDVGKTKKNGETFNILISNQKRKLLYFAPQLNLFVSSRVWRSFEVNVWR